jgi:signal-transduction protein with cAMP-binding, CBS, and nucleotidyltransferase domain
MQLLEQKSFISKISPFNRLDDDILEELCVSLDVVYFKDEEIIFKEG